MKKLILIFAVLLLPVRALSVDPVRNFAKVTVSRGYDVSATSIQLTPGHGSKLPDPSVDGAFNLVWWASNAYPDPADDPYVEIIRVTARSGDVLTVTRGQEGIAARAHSTTGVTYRMVLGVTKKLIDDLAGIDSVGFADSVRSAGTVDSSKFATSYQNSLKINRSDSATGYSSPTRLNDSMVVARALSGANVPKIDSSGGVRYVTQKKLNDSTAALRSAMGGGSGFDTAANYEITGNLGLYGNVEIVAGTNRKFSAEGNGYVFLESKDTADVFYDASEMGIVNQAGAWYSSNSWARQEKLVSANYFYGGFKNKLYGTSVYIDNSTYADSNFAMLIDGGVRVFNDVEVGAYNPRYGEILPANLTVRGNVTFVPTTVPATSTDTGTPGMISWDENYFYVCIAENSWKRVAISAGGW